MTVLTSANSPLQIAELAAGGGWVGLTLCPGKRGDSLFGARWERDLATDLAAVRGWGATAVVTLLEESEFALLGVEALPQFVAQHGMEWHHLPITDVSPPDARFLRRWRLAGPRLRSRLARGERVLVHCRGGLGRAGTVAALILVECGVSDTEAVARVRAARPGAIETDAQERWVRALRRSQALAAGRRERELACLLGGALGDALGYRVEFDRREAILRRYGPAGITLAQATGGLVVSDDTQMTLFTLEGMARAATPSDIIGEVRRAYRDWLRTQGTRSTEGEIHGQLARSPVLCHARAPGNTCLSALRQGGGGSVERRINDSKGCGGVMRTAPLGFLPATVSDAEVFRLGVETAALTHGHADGFLPAGAMALLTRHALAEIPWEPAVGSVLGQLTHLGDSSNTVAAIEAAARAAAGVGAPSHADVAKLGLGWVGEEALAIGLYCAMSAASFAECIELAANHDGDSDSTASLAGQLYAARHGLEVLPWDAVQRLDVLEPLLEVFGEWGRNQR